MATLPRIAADGLAVNRILFGLNYVVRPGSATWAARDKLPRRSSRLALTVAAISTAVAAAAAAGLRPER